MSINNQILGTMAQIATYDATNGKVTDLTVGGNVTANYFFGNIANAIGFNAYSNANVASYLPTYSGNLANLGGNVTTTANVSGNYFLGNGSLLTGISSSKIFNGSSNVQVYANGNVTITAAGVANILTVSSTGIVGNANLTVGNANISANYFLGNGAFLTGVITSVSNVVNGNSNIQVYANSNVAFTIAGVANVITFTPTSASFTGNINATSNLTVTNNAYFTANTFTTGNANVTANVYALGNLLVTNNAYFSSNTFTSANSTSNITIANAYVIKSGYANTVFGSNTTVDTFPSSLYLMAEYNYYWQLNANASAIQFGKFVVSQDGTTAYIDIYSVGGSNVSEQILFTASYATGNVIVSANAISNSANAVIRIGKTYTSV